MILIQYIPTREDVLLEISKYNNFIYPIDCYNAISVTRIKHRYVFKLLNLPEHTFDEYDGIDNSDDLKAFIKKHQIVIVQYGFDSFDRAYSFFHDYVKHDTWERDIIKYKSDNEISM